MSKFIWFFLLFAACQNISDKRNNVTSMAFDYVGESDKPFISLFMTTKKGNLRNEKSVKSIFVSEETLQFIDKFIEKNSSLFLQKEALDRIENIAFRFGINNYKFVLIERKETVTLFKKLSTELLSNDKLNRREVSLINEYLGITIVRMDW